MSFHIRGLSPESFAHLFDLSPEALAAHGARACVAHTKPGYPDRVGLRDAEVGERLVLVNHVHQPADNPYRASHAIFVAERSTAAFEATDTVPDALQLRVLSLRAFDAKDMLVDADLAQGDAIAPTIERLFEDTRVAYLHAHFAKPGCFAARIDRR